MDQMIIRLEEEKDYILVEKLTRDAFYKEERINDLGVPCCEHYMVHELRKKDGIKELDFVAEVDGKVVGHVIYSNAHIQQADDSIIDVLNFGPLSVLPTYQNKGIGSALMRHSIKCAKDLGYKAIIFYGHPTYYPRFGFVEAKEFGITTKDGSNFPAFMAMELQSGFLKNIAGRFIESPIYSEKIIKGPAKEFDKTFNV